MKRVEQMQLGPASFRAQFEPSTFNADERTIELVWSAGAKVDRWRPRGWEIEEFEESLSLEPSHVRLDRLNSGAPLLDNHRTWGGVRDVLGVVDRAWTAKGEGRAVVRFSMRADVEDVVRDVRAGIIRNVSVGYRVHDFEDLTEKDAKKKHYRAVDWEPYEVSLVLIPADIQAGVRSAAVPDSELYTCDVYRREDPMTKPTFGAGLESETRTAPETSAPAAPAAATPAPSAPSAPSIDLEAERAAAITAERARVREIEEHCTTIRLAPEATRQLVDLGKPLGQILPQLRAAYADQVSAQGNGDFETRSRVSVGTEDETLKRTAIESALYHRMNPTLPVPAELGEYRGRSIVDLMRFGIAAKEGYRAAMRLGRDEVIKRALHATSDFGVLLQESGRRTLRAQYEKQPTTYQMFTAPGTLPDFKATKRARIGDAPAMEQVPEGAEIKHGTTSASSEPIELLSYGKAIGLTYQAIVNDDLGAFAKMLASQARTVAVLVENLVYAQLVSGTVGGASIYSAANSTSGGGSALTPNAAGIAALEALAVLMKNRTNEEGDFLAIMPKFIIVPTTLHLTAKQLLTEIQLTTRNEVNPYRGMIDVIASPRLNTAPTAWYLAADPNAIDTIEVAWLEGRMGPQFDMKESFETRGITYSCWADVAAKVIDDRGLAKSAGQ